MEVNKYNFHEQLFPILNHIANATYVTFDLEMSGISTRPRYQPGDRSHEIGKPSLQQLYEENKLAAETYQTLQLGITCVEEDREKEFYLARPFNFPLSPLSAGGVDLKLDRTFAFSSSACDFLKANGFDFGKVFEVGVPYLSQQEEYDIRDEFNKRADNNKKIPDLVIPLDDAASLKFFREARKKIGDWANARKPEYPYLNISREDGPLNGFQRRLIYQLVRSDFPTLRVFARNKGDFMQVEKLDEKREAVFQKQALEKLNAQIAKQKGLRWIYEALTNGDLSGINPEWFCDPDSEDPETEKLLKKQEFARLRNKLKKKMHIIVGHNLFTDLIFVHRTFIGKLPRTVKHFQEDIHENFPVVIDTKFLATYGEGKMQLRNNLKDLLAPFKTIHRPLILLAENHNSYGATLGKEHEAGYDSWMTAELFLKLSIKRYDERKQTLAKEDRDTDTEDIASLSIQDEISSSSDESSKPSVDLSLSGGGVMLSADPVISSSVSPAPSSKGFSKLPIDWHIGEIKMSGTADVKLSNGANGSAKGRQWLPKFDSSFWDIYINKLRVNASDAGVCDLEGAED